MAQSYQGESHWPNLTCVNYATGALCPWLNKGLPALGSEPHHCPESFGGGEAGPVVHEAAPQAAQTRKHVSYGCSSIC